LARGFSGSSPNASTISGGTSPTATADAREDGPATSGTGAVGSCVLPRKRRRFAGRLGSPTPDGCAGTAAATGGGTLSPGLGAWRFKQALCEALTAKGPKGGSTPGDADAPTALDTGEAGCALRHTRRRAGGKGPGAPTPDDCVALAVATGVCTLGAATTLEAPACKTTGAGNGVKLKDADAPTALRAPPCEAIGGPEGGATGPDTVAAKAGAAGGAAAMAGAVRADVVASSAREAWAAYDTSISRSASSASTSDSYSWLRSIS